MINPERAKIKTEWNLKEVPIEGFGLPKKELREGVGGT